MSALLVWAKWFQSAWVLSTKVSICGKADRGPFAVTVSGIGRSCWSCSAKSMTAQGSGSRSRLLYVAAARSPLGPDCRRSRPKLHGSDGSASAADVVRVKAFSDSGGFDHSGFDLSLGQRHTARP
jgi:hypothetical protein